MFSFSSRTIKIPALLICSALLLSCSNDVSHINEPKLRGDDRQLKPVGEGAAADLGLEENEVYFKENIAVNLTESDANDSDAWQIKMQPSQLADSGLLVSISAEIVALPNVTIKQTMWTQISGPLAAIYSPYAANTAIMLPNISTAADLVFRFSALDDQQVLRSATTKISAAPLADTFQINSPKFDESTAQISFTVTLAQPAETNMVFNYHTEDASAIAGQDYEAANDSLFFTAGESQKTIAINILEDNLREGTEQFILAVQSASEGQSIIARKAIGVIVDAQQGPITTLPLPFANIDLAKFVDDNLRECVTNTGITKVTDMIQLVCDGWGISDASGIEQLVYLTTLNLFDNQLTTIDVSANTALKTLSLQDNQLTAIDISADTLLDELYLAGNFIPCVDIQHLIGQFPTVTESDCIAGSSTSSSLRSASSTSSTANSSPAVSLSSTSNISSFSSSSNSSATTSTPSSSVTSSSSTTTSTPSSSVASSSSTTTGAPSSSSTSSSSATTSAPSSSSTSSSSATTSAPSSSSTSSSSISSSSFSSSSDAASANIPDAFRFSAQTDVALNSPVISNVITLSGMTSKVPISIDGGEYSLNGGTTFTAEMGEVAQGDQVVVRLVSSQSSRTTTRATVNIGGVKGVFSVTTLDLSNIIDWSKFSDPALRECVTATGATKISELVKLECVGLGISDATGIGQLTSLTTLNLAQNQLIGINVSANTALRQLTLYENQIASIDISFNTALTRLSLSNNYLSSIDVSSNTELTSLGLNNNLLVSLDVAANTALTVLNIGDNQLTSVDLSSNTALRSLTVLNNKLTALDVSSNTALTSLSLSNNQLKNIDVSANTALSSLSIMNNLLTTIDVSANPSLITLWLRSNQLTSIDISANTALTTLNLPYNLLTAVDLSFNTALEVVWLDNNRLTMIDVSENTVLESLDLRNNKLTAIDVSANPVLDNLYLDDNLIPCADIQDLIARFSTVGTSSCVGD